MPYFGNPVQDNLRMELQNLAEEYGGLAVLRMVMEVLNRFVEEVDSGMFPAPEDSIKDQEA